jgi:hypothetical protein
VLSALRLVLGIEAEVHERVVTFACLEDHVATATAVTAGRPATRDELLSAEGDATVAAVAGRDSDFGLIDEHLSNRKRRDSETQSLAEMSKLKRRGFHLAARF